MSRSCVLTFVFAVACTTTKPNDSGGDSAVVDMPGETTVVAFSDADNYSYAGGLVVEEQTVAAEEDIHFSWSGLTRDVYSNPVVATNISAVEILNFEDYGQQEVLDGIAAGTFLQSDINIYAYCWPEGETSCSLSEFVMGAGHALDLPEYFVGGSGTWLLRLKTIDSTEPMADLFLVPSDKSEETEAIVTDASSAYETTCAMKSVSIPVNGDIVFDWSAVSVDGAGKSWDPTDANRVVLGHFDNGTEEMELRPYLFSELADTFWSATLSNETSIRLDEFSSDAGQPPDFSDTSATWMFAIFGEGDDPRMPSFLVELEPK